MKRDIDLARQLLLDIESRGADCSVSVLRTGPNHDAEERIRYHLRLLIDAGLLKEVDRTASGVPCVRLTHDGHETIELIRNEARWREAKWICQQRCGGLSLTVVRGILLRWAVSSRYASTHPTYGRRRRSYVPTSYVPSHLAHTHLADEDYYRVRSGYRMEPYRFDGYYYPEARETWQDDDRYVWRHADNVDRWRERWHVNGADLNGDGVV
ncbi:MAG: DUF2513 domain-containing protein, partial [Planctomycetales bacterium]|nr:DUF2513 domain-containing protein [Planctomycetales bacterium]